MQKQGQDRKKLVIDSGIILYQDEVVRISYQGQIERLKANCKHHTDKNGKKYLYAPKGFSVTNKTFIND